MWFELIGSLGLGSQVVISLSLVLVAAYIWRVAALAKLAGALVGSAVGYLIVVVVALAAAVAAGWVDLHPSVIRGHVATWGVSVVEALRGIVR